MQYWSLSFSWKLYSTKFIVCVQLLSYTNYPFIYPCKL